MAPSAASVSTSAAVVSWSSMVAPPEGRSWEAPRGVARPGESRHPRTEQGAPAIATSPTRGDCCVGERRWTGRRRARKDSPRRLLWRRGRGCWLRRERGMSEEREAEGSPPGRVRPVMAGDQVGEGGDDLLEELVLRPGRGEAHLGLE